MRIDPSKIANFEAEFGPVPKVLSRLIRPAFIAAPGHTLVWGDWSAIEARTLPWLAGEPGEEVLDVFRTNDADPSLPDIYKVEAGGIYDIEPTDVSKDERQVGKVAILALGFGGGVGALDAMATGYGLDMEPSFQKFIVDRWRANNEWAVAFWSELNDAFFRAWEKPETVHTAGRVAFIFLPDYLFGTMFCYLPDGRPITYTKLKREKITYEDDETAEEVTEWKVRYQKGYERSSLWHGILAENITQGTAASLLRDLLRRNRKGPYDFVFHTHDEAGLEVPEDASIEAERWLKKEMEFVPDWAEGLPLVAETSTNWFYTKTVD